MYYSRGEKHMIVVFKNINRYTILRCPKCGKLYFHKFFIPRDARRYNEFKCCECNCEMEYLDLTTDKIEIEF